MSIQNIEGDFEQSNSDLQSAEEPKTVSETPSNNLKSPKVANATTFEDITIPKTPLATSFAEIVEPNMLFQKLAENQASSGTATQDMSTVINAKLPTFEAFTPEITPSLDTTVAQPNIASQLASVPDYNYTQNFGGLVDSNRNKLVIPSATPATTTIPETEKTWQDYALVDNIFTELTGTDEKWINNWLGSSNEEAFFKLVDNSILSGFANVNGKIEVQRFGIADSKISDRAYDSAYVSEGSNFAGAFDHLFGTSLGEKNAELMKSQSVSYNKYLTGLESRVDPTDDNESLGDFFGKVFSKDTLTEIGASFIDAGAEIGMQLLQSLIPSIKNGTKDSEMNLKTDVPVDPDSTNIETFRKLWKEFISKSVSSRWTILTDILPDDGFADEAQHLDRSIAAATTKDTVDAGPNTLRLTSGTSDTKSTDSTADSEDTSKTQGTTVDSKFTIKYENEAPGYLNKAIAKEAIAREIESKVLTDSKIIPGLSGIANAQTEDRSILFDRFVAQNPLLGQHQYLLTITKPESTFVDYIQDDLYDELLFRVKNISIPEMQRSAENSFYGNSRLSLISNHQATSDHKAVISIYCDRNLNVLEYLSRLTGNCICENGKPETGNTVTYNMSAIADDSYTDIGRHASLKIFNGRDLAKIFYAEDREIQLHNQPISYKTLSLDPKADDMQKTGLIEYAKHVYFDFENFKIINLDYSLKFDSTKTDASLLEIKATVTWTKITTNWIDDEDEFYEASEEVEEPEDIFGRILKEKEKKAKEQRKHADEVASANGLDNSIFDK